MREGERGSQARVVEQVVVEAGRRQSKRRPLKHTAAVSAVVLDSLCALGTVESTDGSYALAPVADFLSGNYRNLGDEYWDFLPTFLRTATPLAKMDSAEQSEAQYEQQVSALAWMMTPARPPTAARCRSSWRRGSRCAGRACAPRRYSARTARCDARPVPGTPGRWS